MYICDKYVCMANTIIRISKEVRDKLKAIGRKGETYDEIVRRLIDESKKN